MNMAHLHLILNHLPVLGPVFGLVILAIGLGKKNDALKRLALGVLVISALVAVPAYLTGEPAEDGVKGVAGVAGNLIEQHEEAAGVAFGGVIGLGVVALAGLVMFRRGRPVAGWLGVIALLGSLVVSGLMAYTANLGGQIHHPEIRKGAAVSSGERHD
jgi:uncharacterized membrane protein